MRCLERGFELLISASLCCCGTRAQLPSVATHRPASSDETRTPAVSKGLPNDEVERAIKQIAELRGWPPNLGVQIATAHHDEIVNALVADTRAQMPPSVQKAQMDFLAAFGLVPTGFDFERDVLHRFANDVSGVYCVSCRQVLLTASPDRQQEMHTLRHELVHAFQDSRYGLGAKIRWKSDGGDYVAALHALAEGEATCIELALEDPNRHGCLDLDDWDSLSSSEFSSGLPRVIRDALVAPYTEGLHYVRRLVRIGGWAAVERAWNGELRSTRQLLADTDDEPQPSRKLAMPHELADCELQYLDVVGEQQLRYLISGGTSTNAALPWVEADRMGVWRCPNLTIASIRVRLHDHAAAEELALQLSGGLGLPTAGLNSSCQAFPSRAVSLLLNGRDIAIASVQYRHGHLGAPAPDTCSLTGQLVGRLINLSE